MRNVEILISGPAGSGRACVQLIVAEALKEAGFGNVTIDNNSLGPVTVPQLKARITNKMSKLRQQTSVHIMEHQTPRGT